MNEYQNDQLSEDVEAIPVQHRRVIARWLLADQAMILQDAFSGAAMDLMVPMANDTTTAFAAQILREL